LEKKPMAKKAFRINEPGQVKVEVILTSTGGTFSISCLYFEEGRMMKAPGEGRHNELKSQDFSETTEAGVILQAEHWLKNKFGKEYNLAAYEAKP
jgi:hypothetical protein